MQGNLARIVPVILLCSVMGSAQQSIPAGAKAPQVTPPAPQKHQPPSGPQTSAPVSRAAPSPVRTVAYPGTIMGYVYWDAKAVQHNPPLDCNGLAVTVSVGTPPSGSTPTFEQFKALGTYGNLTYVNIAYLNSSSSPAVCAYSVKVPEGQDLQVQVAATPSAFSPVVAPATPPTANNPNGPIKIPGGTCNKFTPSTPSLSVLGSHWWTCGDYAYNVNFTLQPSNSVRLMSGGNPGLLSGSGSGQSASAPASGGLGLSSVPQSGMLAAGAAPAPTKATNRPALAGSKVELNPQPLPPDTKGGSPARVALKPIRLAPPKALRKVTNPRLAQENASIIAVLQQQRQAAERDSAAMKSGTMSATASGVASRTTTRTAASANFQGNPPQGTVPMKTQSADGTLASSIAHAPVVNTVVLTCSYDTTPRILRVSGGEGPGVFTPEAAYNLYAIVGCSFGQSQPGNAAYIFGGNGFKANLNIDFWSENGITAHLDPWFAGVLDQNNVTLVVSPAGKQQMQKSGFKFYAARGMPASDGSDQEVPLAYNSMRQSNVALFNITNFPAGFDQLPSNAASAFPSFSFAGNPVAGWIFRYMYGHADRIATFRGADCYINDIGYNGAACRQPDEWQPQPDTWDLNKLAPGFAISSYNLYYEDTDPSSLCAGGAVMNSGGSVIGKWDFNLNQQNQISVSWPIYRCYDEEFGTRDNFADQSTYGLAVWVMGPRCVDPWTGQKDQPCLTRVRQILG